MTSGQWKGSNRKAELPPDWDIRRTRVFRRDGYRCTAPTAYGRCPQVATDCDHVGDKLNHELENLTSLCDAHHKAKTAQQGVEARAGRKAARKRPPEVNPGAVV